MKGFFIAVGFVLTICLSFAAKGEGFTHLVKAKSINHTLAEQFPISKTFQGHSATFYQAKIIIDVLDQSIKLQMTASANQGAQILICTLIFDGKMTYDNFSEAYIFEDLSLDSFQVTENTLTNSQEVIKAIKQSLINDFDDLMLFNISELNSFSPNRPADQIDISKQQLRLIWQ